MVVGGEGVPILRGRPVGRGPRRRGFVDVGKVALHRGFLARNWFQVKPHSPIGTTAVASRSTSARSWLTYRIGRFSSSRMRSITAMMSPRRAESSDDRGSYISRISGPAGGKSVG